MGITINPQCSQKATASSLLATVLSAEYGSLRIPKATGSDLGDSMPPDLAAKMRALLTEEKLVEMFPRAVGNTPSVRLGLERMADAILPDLMRLVGEREGSWRQRVLGDNTLLQDVFSYLQRGVPPNEPLRKLRQDLYTRVRAALAERKEER